MTQYWWGLLAGFNILPLTLSTRRFFLFPHVLLGYRFIKNFLILLYIVQKHIFRKFPFTRNGVHLSERKTDTTIQE